VGLRIDRRLNRLTPNTLDACGPSSHCCKSLLRNRHCLPILSAGISRHSAQRHRVRVDTPNHLATAAVVSNGSDRDDDSTFSLSRPTAHSRLWQRRSAPATPISRLRPPLEPLLRFVTSTAMDKSLDRFADEQQV
jgi:hypothetical protein